MADPTSFPYDVWGISVSNKWKGAGMIPNFDASPLRLLDQPSIPMQIRIENGCVKSVTIPSTRRTPALSNIRTLCNLYTRFKFGLDFNYAYLGGFKGKNFEVGNYQHRVGIYVEHYDSSCVPFPVNNADDFLNLVHERGLVLPTDTPPFIKTYLSVNEVISVWAFVMQTLLRHDWADRSVIGESNLQSICADMLKILLNIMSYEELCAFLKPA